MNRHRGEEPSRVEYPSSNQPLLIFWPWSHIWLRQGWPLHTWVEDGHLDCGGRQGRKAGPSSMSVSPPASPPAGSWLLGAPLVPLCWLAFHLQHRCQASYQLLPISRTQQSGTETVWANLHSFLLWESGPQECASQIQPPKDIQVFNQRSPEMTLPFSLTLVYQKVARRWEGGKEEVSVRRLDAVGL